MRTKPLAFAVISTCLFTCGQSPSGVSITGAAFGTATVSAITASFTAGRSTVACAHPCAVVFEATGTTDTEPSIAEFHELRYTWDFGDSRAETWARDGRDKNTELGPIAAHVFECPTADTSGTVTLTVSRDGTTSDTATMDWDCDAPTTQWATTDVKCVSDTADVSWCPAGATTRANETDFDNILQDFGYLVADRMIILRCGGSYTSNETTTLNVGGPGYIGGNNCGSNRPLVTRTSDTDVIAFGGGGASPAMDDWRITNIRILDDTANRVEQIFVEAGRVRNLTFHDVILDDCGDCIEFLGSQNDFYRNSVGQSVTKGFVISEVIVTRNKAMPAPISGQYPIVMMGEYSALIGSDANSPNDDAGTHAIRLGWEKYFTIAHSYSREAANTRHLVKQTCEYGGFGDCQYITLISNTFEGDMAWGVVLGDDSGSGTDGLTSDVLVYDNFMNQTGDGFQIGFLSHATNSTFARNVIRANYSDVSYGIEISSCGVDDGDCAGNAATGGRAYHNTFTDPNSNSGFDSLGLLIGTSGGEAVGNLTAVHSNDADADGIACSPACSPQANNLTYIGGTFPFVTLPPVTESDFELSAATTPIDYVSTAHYWEYDHAGVACSGNCDAGAYERE